MHGWWDRGCLRQDDGSLGLWGKQQCRRRRMVKLTKDWGGITLQRFQVMDWAFEKAGRLGNIPGEAATEHG